MQSTCTIEGCQKEAISRGWCRTHYTRWYETGDTALGVRAARRTNYRITAPAERVLRRIHIAASGCWEYQGALTHGYGMIRDSRAGKNMMAHRAVWEHLRSSIPEGYQIDHLCRNKRCVNPDHLEPVTASENTRRGLAPVLGSIHNSSKTHCPQGHAYDEENTYRNNGRRACRTCGRAYMTRRRAAQRKEVQHE